MKSFFLIFFLFFLSCGDDVKEKVYDDCVLVEYSSEYNFYSCTFLKLEDEQKCLDQSYIYNQFTKKCTKPICDENYKYCINGCDVSENKIISVVCGNEFIEN